MKSNTITTFLCLLLWVAFLIYAVTQDNTRVISEEIVANTSAFEKGNLVILTKYGLRLAQGSDACDTVGIVTCVGDSGKIILKYKR